MKILLIILTILITSCGDDPVITPDANCTVETSLINDSWTSDISGVTYHLQSCSPYTTCRLCFHFSCSGTHDIDLDYYPNGEARIEYLYYSKVVTANWQICNGVLELYNFSDGSNPETFR